MWIISKSHCEKKNLHLFQSPHEVDMKNVVAFWQEVFGYFNALETHTLYLSALDFCNSPVWIIEFDELEFYRLWQAEKFSSNLEKKSTSENFQTRELQKSSADG